MDQLLETVSVDIDEPTEFLFNVKVEGADPSPTKVRLVCESGDMSYMFNGKSTRDGLVQFNVPSMKGKLNEGMYKARVEVLIDNRYFAPVQFQLDFKRTVSVVAEIVTKPSKKELKEVKVTAAPVTVKSSVKNEDIDLFR